MLINLSYQHFFSVLALFALPNFFSCKSFLTAIIMCIKRHPELTESISFQNCLLRGWDNDSVYQVHACNPWGTEIHTQHPCKELALVACACNSNVGNTEAEVSLGPLGKAAKSNLWAWLPIRDPVPNIMVDLSLVDLRPLSSTCVHTHIGLFRPLYFQVLPFSLCFNHLALTLRKNYNKKKYWLISPSPEPPS